MLTESGCLARRQRLWNEVPAEITHVLIADARHVQYFCNFRVQPLSFSADQRSLLLLSREGDATLLADNFTRRTATVDVFANEEITKWYTHKQSVINRDQALLNALSQVSFPRDAKVLIETEAVPHAIAAALPKGFESAWNDETGRHTAGEIIRKLRRQKHDDEVAVLKTAMQAGAAGHAAAFDAAIAGATDLDVYLAIQQAAQRKAACAAVLYGDFRSTNPGRPKAGGLPGNIPLEDGDLLILDFSVILHGYRSDFTNTIAIGSPSDAAMKQFEACEAAMKAAEEQLSPGADCKEIYNAASAAFEDRNFPPLPHHCGHGLGLEHPEPPILVPESSDTLELGDVVTIEPGQYIEGTGGIRIEHNYLITEAGYERLSDHRIALK